MPPIDQFSLAGRRALVTGGGSGLGRGMAEGLAEAGAQVCILGRSANVDEAAQAIGAVAVRANLTDRVELRRGFDEAVERLEGLDILVTSHGEVHSGPAVDHPLDRWDDVVESNLTAVFELCQLAGRIFLAQSRGKIINVASMLSFFGGLNVVSYAASKGGVAQLTKALANEWSGQGINVNAIAPGYLKTKMNAHIWRDNPARSEQILARLPSGRWGEPSDLKGPVVFLASPASDYLHGIVLPVDGGFLAR
jgi:2-dehydro-3-deoxy-D-gluconate 5-dehydrogenase